MGSDFTSQHCLGWWYHLHLFQFLVVVFSSMLFWAGVVSRVVVLPIK